MIPSTKHTAQYNTIFNILLFFIIILFFLTKHILLLIFNYFFLFILNHTRLLSPRFLHFILLNFITSSSTLLHLRFAFLLIRNFCVFYQYQCDSGTFQVESQISQYDFFLVVQVPLFIYFLFIYFPFEIFWFTECKFVLILRNFFFFFNHKLHADRILNFGRYLPKHLK